MLWFNGPSSASKAALEAFADVYRGELKPFGVDFVMVQAGNMRTGGPAKTAAALKSVADKFTDEQRQLYGKALEVTTADLIPGIELSAQALTSTRLYRRFEATAYAPKIGDNKTHGEVWFSYRRRMRDNFFGIGPLYQSLF